ncbi:MAG: hypothetical protein H8F28_20725 [Fibrella sp.]|nr:hypothetical protein [Armatimonadota bacterium]
MATTVIKKGQPGSKALFKDSFLLHKLHSLSGVFPIGFFMIFHLTANSYALRGETEFNTAVKAINYAPFVGLLEIAVIAIPILFHAIYGVFIVREMQGPGGNVAHYGYSRNWLYILQRWSGVVALGYLLYHAWDTSLNKRIIEWSGMASDDVAYHTISYAAMVYRFADPVYLLGYIVGILASAFHLGNGIFNFTIRWGIAIGKQAQQVSAFIGWGIGIGLTLMGWWIAGNFYLKSANYADAGPIRSQYTSVLDLAKKLAAKETVQERQAGAETAEKQAEDAGVPASEAPVGAGENR